VSKLAIAFDGKFFVQPIRVITVMNNKDWHLGPSKPECKMTTQKDGSVDVCYTTPLGLKFNSFLIFIHSFLILIITKSMGQG